MDPKEASNEKKRILKEMIDTVQRHCDKFALIRRLSTLLEGAAVGIKGLTEEDVKKVFPAFETIYSFHREAILPGLKQCLANWETSPYIGPVVKEVAPWSRCYVDYIPRYDSSMVYLKKLKSQYPRFGTFVSEIEKKREFGGLRIKDHLLDPLHHLTRYNTILERFAKYCSGNEHADIVETVHAVADTISACEKNMKQDKEFTDLMEVQRQLSCNISQPGRRVMYRGDVTEIEPLLEPKPIPRHVVMFNDKILVCQIPANKIVKMPIKHDIDVDAVRIEPANHLEAVGFDTKLLLHIRLTRRTLTLQFTSTKARTQWEKAFKALAAQVPDGRHAPMYGYELFAEAPTVLPAASADKTCMMCSEKFSLLRKKNSCEGCGKVVCSKCITHKLPLPFANDKMLKVCSRCFVRGTDMGMTGRSRASSQSSQVSAADSLDSSCGLTASTPTRPMSYAGTTNRASMAVPKKYYYCIWESRTLREWTSTDRPSKLLQKETRQDAFLVHKDEKKENTYIISVKHTDTVTQFAIDFKDGKYGCNERQRFHTMSDVVAFYRKKPIHNGKDGNIYLLNAVSNVEATRV